MTPIEQDGYGVSTGYTHGYFRRLSPTWLRFIASVHGVPFPEGEPLRYFELGFGQGVSLNVHAAANPGEYWGNDYNPEHVAFARQTAEASGANIHLLEDSFETLAERRDLPQFNVIVAHGIWSWISETDRAAILRFVDERLTPGGLLYLSYNALPGSASGMAIQRFLSSASRAMGGALEESVGFDRARDLLRTIKDEAGGHFDHYPQAKERLEKVLAGTSPYYLHEYMVRSWKPMLLLEVATQLQGLGFEFCGSAHLTTADLQDAQVGRDPMKAVLDETLRDFGIDRAFRADIFVRQYKQKPQGEKPRLWDQEVALTVLPDDVDLTPTKPEDSVVVQPLRDILEKLERSPSGISRVGDLISAGASNPAQSCAALANALNAGLVHPASVDRAPELVERSARVSDFLAAHLPQGGGRSLRVSPVVGSAVKWRDQVSPGIESTTNIVALASELATASGQKISPALALREAVTHASRAKMAKRLNID